MAGVTGPAVVVKVGGSLLDWPGLSARLSRHLDGRRAAGERVVIVAGGGAFADAIRALDAVHALGDDCAHALAIRAMDLTARALAAIVPGLVVVEDIGDLGSAWAVGATPILAPRRFLEEDEPRPDALPHSWDVTSDSIAARLAERLGAGELCLLKSVPAAEGADRASAAHAGLVDPFFPVAARSLRLVTCLDLRGSAPGESPRPLPGRDPSTLGDDARPA